MCKKSGKNYQYSCPARLSIHDDGRVEESADHNHDKISNVERLLLFRERLKEESANKKTSLSKIYKSLLPE